MFPNWKEIEKASKDLYEFFAENYPETSFDITIDIWGRPWHIHSSKRITEIQLSLLHPDFEGGCKLVNCKPSEMLRWAKVLMPKASQEVS